MKTSKLLAVALIATLGFTACSNDDEIMNSSADIIKINSSINEAAPTTRATIDYTGAGTFDPGDIWGMYATVGGSHVLTNSAYTVGTTSLLWSALSETVPVTFAAHYPRITSTITDPTAYMFNAATATNPDLLVAAPVTKSKGEAVDLTFNHVMHQLLINLSKGPEIPGSLFDVTVTLLNMKSSAKVNLLTGAVDVSAASGTDAYPVKGAAEAFVVAPQQLTVGTDWIQLELDGKAYIFKVPASLTELQSGKRQVLTLTLKKKPDGTTTVILTDQGITGWVSQGGTIIGNADEQ